MLTVLSWLWRSSGRRPGVYDHTHVHALSRMLKKHMSAPYRHICVTDSPDGITECETFPLWDLAVVQKRNLDCYRRLRLFDPAWGAQFGERILSIDLDVLIRGDLSSLIDESRNFQAMRGTCSLVNGSLWSLEIGTNARVWHSFNPKTAAKIISVSRNRNGSRLVGSDQAWLSLTLPGASLWDHRHGLWHYKQLVRVPEAAVTARMIAFSGDVKPWDENLQIAALRDEYLSYL